MATLTMIAENKEEMSKEHGKEEHNQYHMSWKMMKVGHLKKFKARTLRKLLRYYGVSDFIGEALFKKGGEDLMRDVITLKDDLEEGRGPSYERVVEATVNEPVTNEEKAKALTEARKHELAVRPILPSPGESYNEVRDKYFREKYETTKEGEEKACEVCMVKRQYQFYDVENCFHIRKAPCQFAGHETKIDEQKEPSSKEDQCSSRINGMPNMKMASAKSMTTAETSVAGINNPFALLEMTDEPIATGKSGQRKRRARKEIVVVELPSALDAHRKRGPKPRSKKIVSPPTRPMTTPTATIVTDRKDSHAKRGEHNIEPMSDLVSAATVVSASTVITEVANDTESSRTGSMMEGTLGKGKEEG